MNQTPYCETSEQMTGLMRDVTHVVPNSTIPDGWVGVDIGPETIAVFKEALKGCKTVLWNGTLFVSFLFKFTCDKGTLFAQGRWVSSRTLSMRRAPQPSWSS